MKLIIRRNVLFSILAISVLLIVVAFGTAYYFYIQYHHLKVAFQSGSQTDAYKTIAEVADLMDLPQDEQPTVATVSDVTTLRSKPFFAHAELGDKVLIYERAKKAILYNPSQHKIIEVALVD